METKQKEILEKSNTSLLSLGIQLHVWLEFELPDVMAPHLSDVVHFVNGLQDAIDRLALMHSGFSDLACLPKTEAQASFIDFLRTEQDPNYLKHAILDQNRYPALRKIAQLAPGYICVESDVNNCPAHELTERYRRYMHWLIGRRYRAQIFLIQQALGLGCSCLPF